MEESTKLQYVAGTRNSGMATDSNRRQMYLILKPSSLPPVAMPTDCSMLFQVHFQPALNQLLLGAINC